MKREKCEACGGTGIEMCNRPDDYCGVCRGRGWVPARDDEFRPLILAKDEAGRMVFALPVLPVDDYLMTPRHWRWMFYAAAAATHGGPGGQRGR